VAARVVLPPSGTTLLFAAPRNAVAARLTCRKRFRPIYSCSRIRMDYSPASLRPGEPSVDRVHSPRRACSRATRANVGTSLEPFASLRTLEEPRCKDLLLEFQWFDWWSNEDSNQGPARFYRRRATGSVRGRGRAGMQGCRHQHRLYRARQSLGKRLP
jgi:hypothetical protein